MDALVQRSGDNVGDLLNRRIRDDRCNEHGSSSKTEIGLVLQGGGALGAYEWGAITALFDVIDEAIGKRTRYHASRRHRRIDRSHQRCLRGRVYRSRRRAQPARRDVGRFHDRRCPTCRPRQIATFALYECPALLHLSLRPVWRRRPGRTSTKRINCWRHLPEHVDFDALNANETAFVITAVDVESGVLTRFTNQSRRHRADRRSSRTTSWRAAASRRNFPGPTSAPATAMCVTTGTAASSTTRRSAMRSMRSVPIPALRGCWWS